MTGQPPSPTLVAKWSTLTGKNQTKTPTQPTQHPRPRKSRRQPRPRKSQHNTNDHGRADDNHDHGRADDNHDHGRADDNHDHGRADDNHDHGRADDNHDHGRADDNHDHGRANTTPTTTEEPTTTTTTEEPTTTTTTEEPTTTTATVPVRALPESVFIERYDVYRTHYTTPEGAQHDTEGNYIVLPNWFRGSLGWACGVHAAADIEATVRQSFGDAGYPDSWFNVLDPVPGIVEDGCEDPETFGQRWYWEPVPQPEPELSDEDATSLAAWATVNVCQLVDFDSDDLDPFAVGAVMLAEFASRELGVDLVAVGIDFEAAQEILWDAWLNSEDC